MPAALKQCGTCEYQDKVRGTCVRYPPIVAVFPAAPGPIVKSVWPDVVKTDTCGEWKELK